MKKVLILGAHGMAGHMITMYFKTLPMKYEVYTLCHNIKLEETSILLDVHDLNSLKETIEGLKPDIVVNSIGILNKNADKKPSDTIFINSYLPKYMEEKLMNTNIKLVHLSTDCVFSGEKGNYSEASIPDGYDLYGRTKILGEVANPKDLTVRTSIIGPELKNDGTGLFHWFMNQKKSVRGYSKVIWSGVTTLQLAKSLDLMIESNLSGLFNLTSVPPINKYELLKIIDSVFSRNMIIENFEAIKNDKSMISNRKDFIVSLPGYMEMIKELKAWMEINKELYSQYFIVR